MRSFKDTEGREWLIAINGGTLPRIRALAGVDLLTVLDDDAKLLGRLYDDLYLLVEIGWALVKPEAEARQVTAEQFASALGGDVLLSLADVIVEELADFFPDARKRAILREFVRKAKVAADELMVMGAEALEKVDASSVAKLVISSFGGSPEKSASTPAD